jgi:hypothetical protein
VPDVVAIAVTVAITIIAVTVTEIVTVIDRYGTIGMRYIAEMGKRPLQSISKKCKVCPTDTLFSPTSARLAIICSPILSLSDMTWFSLSLCLSCFSLYLSL